MTIDFGNVTAGSTSTQTASMSAQEYSTAAIQGDGGFVLGLYDSINGVANVSFTAEFVPAGAKTATLTYGPDDASTSVPLQATVVHELTFDQSSYAAGDVAVSASAPVTVLVTNHTDHTARLTATGDFFVDPSEVSTGVGATAVTVTFSPSATGNRTGTLTAQRNSTIATASLSGVGTTPTTDDLESVTYTESASGGGGTDTKTTYKVHVPSWQTRMHLGAAVDPFPNLDGFGLRTLGKGLLQASGNIGINSSNGDIRLQAQSDSGSVVSVSGGNSIFAAKQSAYLVGDGGVLVTTALNVSTTVGNDGIPNVESLTAGSNAAAVVFAAFDGFVALASAVRVIKTTKWTEWKTTNKKGKVGIGAAAVSAGAALTATFLAGNSVGGGLGGTPIVPVPGVTIYGHAGVLLGTPGFGGFYAAAGLVLSSVFPIMIGMDAEILGLRSAGVTGLQVAIDGWNDVEIKAGKHIEATSGKKIDLRVNTGTGVENWFNLNDKNASILVGKYVMTFASGGVMVGSASKTGAVDTKKPYVEITDSQIYAAAKKDGSHLTILDDQIDVRHKKNGCGLQVTDTNVSVQSPNGKYEIMVQNDLINLQAGSSSNKVQLSSTGIVAKGSLIKWN